MPRSSQVHVTSPHAIAISVAGHGASAAWFSIRDSCGHRGIELLLNHDYSIDDHGKRMNVAGSTMHFVNIVFVIVYTRQATDALRSKRIF